MSEAGTKGIFHKIYFKHYKKLLIIPIVLIILSIAQIAFQIHTTGDFVDKSVSLKGGISLTIETPYEDAPALEAILIEKFDGADISVREQSSAGEHKGLIIEAASEIGVETLVQATVDVIQEPTVDDIMNSKGGSTIGTVSSEFGEDFFATAIRAVIFAFIFMAVVVFLYFRVPVPSIAVILAAASDIIFAVAAFNLTGNKLSEGGIAALLMLVGYSVDTDILLSTRVLKNKEGTVYDRTIGAMKTGMLMTLTTLAAVTAGLILAESVILHQVFLILVLGLIGDILMTWLQNAVILRWYLEKKGQK